MLSQTISNDLSGVYEVSDALAESYHSDGHVKLKRVLAAETTSRFEKAVTAEVRKLNKENRPLEKRDTYGRAFLQTSNIWEVDAVVAELVKSRKLARIAAELMGVAGVRLYHDHALYKEPGSGHTPWHADQFYWPLQTDHTITAWIPLQKTPLEMGPLAFSRGSQQYLSGRELEISDESDRKIGDLMRTRAESMVEKAYDLGEVSFHSGWTFHRAGANKSTEFRKVMTIIYFADGSRLASPRSKHQQADWDRWMPGASIGEPVATPLNSLLYSRD